MTHARSSLLVILLFLFSLGSTLQAQSSSGCWTSTAHQVGHGAKSLVQGIGDAPRNAIKPHNLAWELPVAAATGLLIAEADQPASRQITSTSMQNGFNTFSNVGIGLELGSAVLAYGYGCLKHHEGAQATGLLALEGAGGAAAVAYVFKRATNRQRPYQDNGEGEFWEGGTSFASGHAAASFGFASVVAHRSHKRWVPFAVYGMAAAVSMSRYPAKQHYLSDILVGSTIGYVTGTYLTHTGTR